MILIKTMQHEHIDAVYEIECACFTTPWSKESFKRELETEMPPTFYVVALLYEPFQEPKVVGYAGMWHIVNEGHITNVAVHDSHRRKGIAAMLLERLVEIAKQHKMIGLTLEVRVSNHAAQALYEQHGFTSEGVRKGYYADTGEDALVMWKLLPHPH